MMNTVHDPKTFQYLSSPLHGMTLMTLMDSGELGSLLSHYHQHSDKDQLYLLMQFLLSGLLRSVTGQQQVRSFLHISNSVSMLTRVHSQAHPFKKCKSVM